MSCRVFRFGSSVGLLSALVLSTAAARAANANNDPAPFFQELRSGDAGSAPVAGSKFERDPYPWSVGARAFIVPPLGIAGFGAGLDVAYSLLPYLAVGAQYLSFAVDQGADPDYCERCIRSGRGGLAFAEGRLWAGRWTTPYARAGVGLAQLSGQRLAYDRGYGEDQLALGAEVGLDLHYRAASLRVFAFHLAVPGTALDADPFTGFGAQLGVRF